MHARRFHGQRNIISCRCSIPRLSIAGTESRSIMNWRGERVVGSQAIVDRRTRDPFVEIRLESGMFPFIACDPTAAMNETSSGRGPSPAAFQKSRTLRACSPCGNFGRGGGNASLFGGNLFLRGSLLVLSAGNTRQRENSRNSNNRRGMTELLEMLNSVG